MTFLDEKGKIFVVFSCVSNILYSPSIFFLCIFLCSFPHKYQELIRNSVLICYTINAMVCHTLPKAFFDCYLNQILSTSSGHLDHICTYLLIYITVLHRALICDHTAKQLLGACPYHYLSCFLDFISPHFRFI